MDIMEAWLSATIRNDLDQVLGVPGGQPLGSSNGAYEDDESNIRVKASKPGVVQIVKVSHPRVIRLPQYSESMTLSEAVLVLNVISAYPSLS